MRIHIILLLCIAFVSEHAFGQIIIDSCFTTVTPTPSAEFISSTSLANVYSSDVLEWNGTSWVGGFPSAGLSIPPPSNLSGCRAIFIGNSGLWTTGGESFGLALASPLVSGQVYSFNLNYVSHGLGSNGSFSPFFYTNSSPSVGNAYLLGNLPAVGYSWTMNTYTFTATAIQAGHTWIIIGTQPTGTSGLVSAFCINCDDPIPINCNFDLGNDTTLCEGEILTLDATASNATYLWQDNSTGPTFNVTQQGTYWVDVTFDNCSATDTIIVNYNSLPNVNLGNDTILCQGAILTLDATTTNATYLWQNNSSNATFNVTQPGTYWITVTVNNCSITDVILIGEEECEVILELPNVFTPNNDGSNDLFVPIISKGIVSMNSTIYSRWGNIIFETNDLLIKWDGQHVSDGTYFWIVYYTDVNGVKNNLTGYLTILR